MDALLAQSLEKKLPKELEFDYNRRSIAANKINTVLLGRQIVSMVKSHFRTASHMNTVYSYEALYEMIWYGDHEIQAFLFKWYEILDNLSETISQEALRDILSKKMHKSIVLKNDMSHFDREKGKAVTNPTERNDYTYDYLIQLLKRYLANALEDKQVQARKAATLSHPRGKGPNAAPATGTPATPAPKKGGGRDGGGGGGGAYKGAPRKGKGGDGEAAVSNKPCFKHQHSFRGGDPCKFGDNCNFAHGPQNSDAEYKDMRGPSRSPSRDRKQGGKDKKDTPPFTEGANGTKYPRCCTSFKQTGVCNNETKNGTRCNFPHIDQAQWDIDFTTYNGFPPKKKGQ